MLILEVHELSWLIGYIFILVTLDYKSLILLIRKILEGKAIPWEALGGQGYDVQGCVFCTALRVSVFFIRFLLQVTWQMCQ